MLNWKCQHEQELWFSVVSTAAGSSTTAKVGGVSSQGQSHDKSHDPYMHSIFVQYYNNAPTIIVLILLKINNLKKKNRRRLQ